MNKGKGLCTSDIPLSKLITSGFENDVASIDFLPSTKDLP